MSAEIEVKANCYTNGKFCGKCCYNTEMPLTEIDIDRIKKLGYKTEEFVVEVLKSVMDREKKEKKKIIKQLRNVDGKCFFLEDNKCKIYPFRPRGCRIYPLVLDSKDEIVVDDICPDKQITKRLSKEEIEIVGMELRKLVEEMY
jgi:hypothetical protein